MWKDGAQYSGDWFADKPSGFGVENYPDGSSYVGQYEVRREREREREIEGGRERERERERERKRERFGVQNYPEGTSYVGQGVRERRGAWVWGEKEIETCTSSVRPHTLVAEGRIH